MLEHGGLWSYQWKILPKMHCPAPSLQIGDRVRRANPSKTLASPNEVGIVTGVGKKWIGSIPVPAVRVRFPTTVVPLWHTENSLILVSKMKKQTMTMGEVMQHRNWSRQRVYDLIKEKRLTPTKQENGRLEFDMLQVMNLAMNATGKQLSEKRRRRASMIMKNNQIDNL